MAGPETVIPTQVAILGEKVSNLEGWRSTTEKDLKIILDAVTQFKLLMRLSIGGGGLSLLTLAILIVTLVKDNAG